MGAASIAAQIRQTRSRYARRACARDAQLRASSRPRVDAEATVSRAFSSRRFPAAAGPNLHYLHGFAPPSAAVGPPPLASAGTRYGLWDFRTDRLRGEPWPSPTKIPRP